MSRHPDLKCIEYADPLRSGRHPFQTYMLLLAFVSGVPMIFVPPAAESVEFLLPHWVAIAWGVCLVLGSALGLIGAYLPRRMGYANLLTTERAGLALAGSAALVYAVLILVYSGLGRGVSACIIAGFGVSCLFRSHDIAKVIVRAIHTYDSDVTDHIIRRSDQSDFPESEQLNQVDAEAIARLVADSAKTEPDPPPDAT